MEIKTREPLVQELSELDAGDVFRLNGNYFIMADESGRLGKKKVFDL